MKSALEIDEADRTEEQQETVSKFFLWVQPEMLVQLAAAGS